MTGLALRPPFAVVLTLLASMAACEAKEAPTSDTGSPTSDAEPPAPEKRPPTCTPDESDQACTYEDVDLRACLATSGIYGATNEVAVCTTSNCGGQGPSPKTCTDGVKVSARVAGGTWLEAAAHHGLYTLALEPGTYELCPDAAGACTGGQCKCISVTIAAGARVRVDRSDQFGAFGRIRTAKVAP